MFPRNSAFDQARETSDPGERQPPDPGPPFRQAAYDDVIIPTTVLEDWIHGLELAENGGDVGDVVAQMRSYFRG
jgi:hypothetical protein